MPLPCNDAELEVISEIYFGRPLHIRALRTWWYEVDEDYNSYHGKGFLFSQHSTEGYDHSRLFWNTVFGRLGTGGIARASYGSFEPHGHRHTIRLRNWMEHRRKKETGRLRAPFVRLARQLSETGGNRVIRGSSVLTEGREDGASCSFLEAP